MHFNQEESDNRLVHNTAVKKSDVIKYSIVHFNQEEHCNRLAQNTVGKHSTVIMKYTVIKKTTTCKLFFCR